MSKVSRKRIPRGRTWALSYQEDRALYLRNYQTHERFRAALDFFETQQHSYIGKRETRVGADRKQERIEANWQVVEHGPDKFPDIDPEVEQIDTILAMDPEPSARERLESERADRIASLDVDIEWQQVKREKEYVEKLDSFMQTWKLDLLDAPDWFDAHGIQLSPPPLRVIVHGWVIDRFLERHLKEESVEKAPLRLSYGSLMPGHYQFEKDCRVKWMIDVTAATNEETVQSMVAAFEEKLRDNLRPVWEEPADAAKVIAKEQDTLEEPDKRQDYVRFADTRSTDARTARLLFDLLVNMQRPENLKTSERRKVLEFADRLGIGRAIVFPNVV